MSRPRETSNNAPKPPSQQEYPLHRLVLSRSPYFSVLMRGPWKDATSPTLTLEIQDPLVDEAAVEVALGFLYEKVPEELTPEALDAFPEGLDDFYAEQLQRIVAVGPADMTESIEWLSLIHI